MTSALGADQQWGPATMLMAKGLNGWPATSGGAIVMASTRNALRLQRDLTQQVFVLPAPTASVPTTPTPPITPPVVIAPEPVVTVGGHSGRFGGAIGFAALCALGLLALRRRR